MAPINKTEAIGIFFSIAVMAVALAYLRFDNIGSTTAITGASQSAVVVVGDGEDQTAALETALSESAADGALEKLVIDDVSRGSGPEVEDGDLVTVHYIGRLQNGQEFDSSYRSGRPFTFTVGEGSVIEGWDLGVVGMQTGGQRVLVIPSDLAYGDAGFGPIPPRATLIFAVELISIN